METISIALYVLISATGAFLLTLLFVPQAVSLQIQNYFFGRAQKATETCPRSDPLYSTTIYQCAAPVSPSMSYTEFPRLRWSEIHFHDKECGFPALCIKLMNISSERIVIERAKFTIGAAGRLHNRVEGHYALFTLPWSYNVQFDPMVGSTVVYLSTVVQPHSCTQLSFTIGQETSDVDTPTLYHFRIQLEDSHGRKIVSKPLTMAIPSPVSAKSCRKLAERANVIAQNAAIVHMFSSFTGYCNPLARRILGHRSEWLPTSGQSHKW